MRVPSTDPKHGVADICEMDLDEIYSKGKQQKKVKSGSLLCFWPACAGTADRAVRELGMSLTDLARYLRSSVSAVGYDMEMGAAIARDNNYQLVD